MRSPWMTIAPFLRTGPPVPSKIVTRSMTSNSSGGVCWASKVASSSTTRVRPVTTGTTRRPLLFDIFLFPFVNQDLQTFLCKEWKHHQSPDGIAPSKSHARMNKERHQQHHRKIRVGKCKNRCCFQGLAPQFYSKEFHIRSNDWNNQHRDRSKDDSKDREETNVPVHACPLARPQLSDRKTQGDNGSGKIPECCRTRAPVISHRFEGPPNACCQNECRKGADDGIQTESRKRGRVCQSPQY